MSRLSPSWKSTKLSLERPYKDDSGSVIPTLLDITHDGNLIYEPHEDWDTKLSSKFMRIFAERGIDFFERSNKDVNFIGPSKSEQHELSQSSKEITPSDAESQTMTPEMLFKMRSEILPRLHIALGEMSHARDMLSLLLSASSPNQPPSVPSLPTGLLTATSIVNQPDILSVRAFNAQLVTGGKDDALRKASHVLKVAAEGVDRSLAKSEKYWSDALKIRKENWRLIPAPLPLGSATGKGADRSARDFLVSFGLEQSPPLFRRKAIAHMSYLNTDATDQPSLVFPHSESIRLRVSLVRGIGTDETTTSHSSPIITSDESLDSTIKAAQMAIIEQEIFDELVKEAGSLPTASARVSERLIVIDAAQNVELRLELVDADLLASSGASSSDDFGQAACDLIYSMLHILLLRAHTHLKNFRLSITGLMRAAGIVRPPMTLPILQPVIDLLQYQVFCNRVKQELDNSVSALHKVGVPAKLRFDSVGESGSDVTKLLMEDIRGKIGGEAVLRIDDRHSVRFTLLSPCLLTAHLPQATMQITSIPHLCQLLIDEMERSLLAKICDIGIDVCGSSHGTWFVDEMMSRSVGRWEGCILNFRVKCVDLHTVDCHAHRLLRKEREREVTGSMAAVSLTYGGRRDQSMGLFEWVRDVIEGTLAH